MNDLLEKLWTHTKASSIIAIALIIGTAFISENIYVFGIYLVSGWLFSPIVTYWLVGEHDLPISFMVNIYPKPLRLFVAYGWFFCLIVLSFVWINLAISVNSR